MTTPLISTTLPAVPCACSDMYSPGKRFREEVRRAAPQTRSQSSEAPRFRQVGCRTRRTAWPGDDDPAACCASRRSSRIVCSSACATSAGVAARACCDGCSAVVRERRPGRDPERHRRDGCDRRDRAEPSAAERRTGAAGRTSRRAVRSAAAARSSAAIAATSSANERQAAQRARCASSSRRSSTASSPSGASAAQTRVRSQRRLLASTRSQQPRVRVDRGAERQQHDPGDDEQPGHVERLLLLVAGGDAHAARHAEPDHPLLVRDPEGPRLPTKKPPSRSAQPTR